MQFIRQDNAAPPPLPSPPPPAQAAKLLGMLGMLWLTFLLIASFTAIKTFSLMGLEFSVAILTYPMVYIIASMFTEVYGYSATRKIVWTGMACAVLASVVCHLYTWVPPSPSFTDNKAFELIFKVTPIMVFIGITAALTGEFISSYILAKMKLRSAGKHIRLRYLTATFFGQSFDNSLFFTGAFLLTGFYKSHQIFPLILSSVLFCTMAEVILLPITKRLTESLKRFEGMDTFDHGTNFNPFKL